MRGPQPPPPQPPRRMRHVRVCGAAAQRAGREAQRAVAKAASNELKKACVLCHCLSHDVKIVVPP
jgi:hypothetical protein